MTRIQTLTLAAFLVPCCVLPAIAQSFQPKTIQFKGDTEYTNSELIAAAQLKKGQVITAAEMNEHTKLLSDTGVFQDISFTFNGQDLVFSLVPVATLYPIRFENLPFPADKDLDQKLHNKLPLYHGKVPTDGGLLEGVREELEEELAAKGIKATLMAAPYTDMKLGKITHMGFTITEPDIEVGDIQFSGVSPAQSAKIKLVAARLTGVSYNTEGSSSQLQAALASFYGAQGYLETKITAQAQPPIADASSVRVPFAVTVDEGPIYRLAGIQLAPDTILTQAAFDKLSGLHPGDIASSLKLHSSLEAIERQYHNKGYMKASVIAAPAFDRTNDTVSYAVSVDAGPVYTMGRLRVLNVSDDLRQIILSAWKVPKGEVFNEGDIRNLAATHGLDPTLQKLFSTMILSYSIKMHDDVHTVDVDLTLEKKRALAQ